MSFVYFVLGPLWRHIHFVTTLLCKVIKGKKNHFRDCPGSYHAGPLHTGHDMSWPHIFNGRYKFYWSKRRQASSLLRVVSSWFSIFSLIGGIYGTFARPESARKSWTSVHSATVFARRLGHYICVESHLCEWKICLFCTQHVCPTLVPW